MKTIIHIALFCMLISNIALAKPKNKKNRPSKGKGPYVKMTVDEVLDMPSGEIFQAARQKAFNGLRVEARQLCDYLIELNPQNKDARMLKGRTLAWDKQYDQATSIFEYLITTHPLYAEGYAGMAQVSFWTQKRDYALDLINKALNLSPDYYEYLFLKAQILKSLGNVAEAISLTERVIQLKPDSEDAKNFLKILKKSL